MNRSGNKFMIMVITDNLQDYENYLTINEHYFNILKTSLNNLKNINPDLLDIKRENLILLINKNAVTSEAVNEIMSYFSQNFEYPMPYFLYLTEKPLDNDEELTILKADNFIYLLPEKNTSPKFYNFNFNIMLQVIFEKIINTCRLNSYIVDSFQNMIDSQIILKQKDEIEILNKELEKLSKIDPLTGLLNRRAFFEAVEKEKKRTARSRVRISKEAEIVKKCIEEADKCQSESNSSGILTDHYGQFSCVLLDIDFFKHVNDEYGHQTGDEVLKGMGNFLQTCDCFRENDIIARYGGEEFILVFPETNSKNAKIPADRFREKMKRLDFFTENGKKFNVTLSIGISEFSEDDGSPEDVISRADLALYYAKEHGRDRVVVYEEVKNEIKQMETETL